MLLANLRARYDAYPSALQALGAWEEMDPDTRRLICHWHVQLSDPLYRAFTGSFLVARQSGSRPTLTHDLTVDWVGEQSSGRWNMATRIQFASKLLTSAHGAGLIVSNRDPRPLVFPRVSEPALTYLMYLLRGVQFEGTLLENPYLTSVGLQGGNLEDRLRGLSALRFRRQGDLIDFGWGFGGLEEWASSLSLPSRAGRRDAMSSNMPLFDRTPLQEAFSALRNDLIHEDGPRISTMRNYRFAIVQYSPRDEFDLRSEVRKLSTELVANGWVVFSINLHKLLLDRVRAQGDEWVRRVIEMERMTAQVAPERGLNYLKSKLTPLIEGPDGIAADCSRVFCDYADRNPNLVDRTLALIGRAGAIYPFFRTSALLRHLDGRTRNVPVVLLYPGERRQETGLSFMGILNPDNDYRPRIYP